MANRMQALQEAAEKGLRRIDKQGRPESAEAGTEKTAGSNKLRSSLVEGLKDEQRSQLQEQGKLVGRPRVEKKKVRVNFSLDESDVIDLRNLASLKNTTFSHMVRDCLRAEFEKNRRDLDILLAMQGKESV